MVAIETFSVVSPPFGKKKRLVCKVCGGWGQIDLRLGEIVSKMATVREHISGY